MKILGSIIARLGSERLPYKNLLPLGKEPLIGVGIRKLQESKIIDEIVVSTESELIAHVAHSYGVKVLRRPQILAESSTPSIPVFQHLVERFPCEVHVNFNLCFPLCRAGVIERAVDLALEKGEALSVPFAVWAQTWQCLQGYGDPFDITAYQFVDNRAGHIDVHTATDLVEVHRLNNGKSKVWFEE